MLLKYNIPEHEICPFEQSHGCSGMSTKTGIKTLLKIQHVCDYCLFQTGVSWLKITILSFLHVFSSV